MIRPGSFMAAPKRRLPWWTGAVAQIVIGLLAVVAVIALAGLVGINGTPVP